MKMERKKKKRHWFSPWELRFYLAYVPGWTSGLMKSSQAVRIRFIFRKMLTEFCGKVSKGVRRLTYSSV